MNPTDFISLAVRLSNSQREADLRTAVSRAYYGSFHLTRHLLNDCGVQLSGKDLYKTEIHQKLRYCLGESGNEDAVLLAKKLGSLRERRNEADYDLDSAAFMSPSSIVLEIRIAQDIVEALTRFQTDPDFSTFRKTVRAYAHDVLRLALEGD